MNYYEEQKKEIATIRNRSISLELSDADVRRIFEKAGQVGLTVSELLQNFIGDLVGGTYSNGSDERDFAQQWFSRCSFGMMSDKTFLRYILEISYVDGALANGVMFLWNRLSENKIELRQMEKSLQEPNITEDDVASIQEDIDCLIEEVSYDTKKLTDLFEDYKKHGGTDASLEVGMEKVLQWQDEFRRLSEGTSIPEQRNEADWTPDAKREV